MEQLFHERYKYMMMLLLTSVNYTSIQKEERTLLAASHSNWFQLDAHLAADIALYGGNSSNTDTDIDKRIETVSINQSSLSHTYNTERDLACD